MPDFMILSMMSGSPFLTRYVGIDPIDPVTSSAMMIGNESGCSAESRDSLTSSPYGDISEFSDRSVNMSRVDLL